VARAGERSGPDSFWSRRMLEWMIVAAVVLAVSVLLIRQANVVKGQAELAAIRTTLAALRTALVIDHLHRTAGREAVAVAEMQRNPFELLQSRPPNFMGLIPAGEVDRLPGGAWMYDPECTCLAYRPMDMDWFFSPDGSAVAWFQVSPPPGPLLISAKVAYRWRGEPLD
jgi:hypothetical protein